MSKPASPLGTSLSHESAHLHVSGEARYVDDFPQVPGLLHAQIVSSPVAAGTLKAADTSIAKSVPGVVDVLLADEIPGANDASPVFHDEPFLAANELHSFGQSICVVVAESVDACRLGMEKVQLEIEERQPILTIRDAIEKIHSKETSRELVMATWTWHWRRPTWSFGVKLRPVVKTTSIWNHRLPR